MKNRVFSLDRVRVSMEWEVAKSSQILSMICSARLDRASSGRLQHIQMHPGILHIYGSQLLQLSAWVEEYPDTHRKDLYSKHLSLFSGSMRWMPGYYKKKMFAKNKTSESWFMFIFENFENSGLKSPILKFRGLDPILKLVHLPVFGWSSEARAW